MSCSHEGNNGCNGGLMDNAFKWIVKNRGIDREDDWPYEAEAGKCGFFARRRRAAQIDGFADVPPGDESALEKAVAVQPVSVAIEADHRSFQLYAGGVFASKDCGTQLDHGVLVVGYGFDAAARTHKHFWKIKNSWGPKWGEEGYIRIAKGEGVRPVRSGDAARVPQEDLEQTRGRVGVGRRRRDDVRLGGERRAPAPRRRRVTRRNQV